MNPYDFFAYALGGALIAVGVFGTAAIIYVARAAVREHERDRAAQRATRTETIFRGGPHND